VCNNPKSEVLPTVLHPRGNAKARNVIYVAKYPEGLSVDEGGACMESGEW
jgi:hypothetical protein